MHIFEHTLNWIRGEIFEGHMLILWGTALIIISLFFWKFGFSPTTRALILPFIIVGAFAAATGGSVVLTNKNRFESFRTAHDANVAEFVKSEEARVESFSKWYRYLLVAWSVLILAGVAVFMFIGGDRGRAIAIGLILLGLTGFLIDHTSEQNARNYASKIRAISVHIGP